MRLRPRPNPLFCLSGLENVAFNDFIDDVIDKMIAALDAVGDYEADATVMLEDVSKDIVIKTRGVEVTELSTNKQHTLSL